MKFFNKNLFIKSLLLLLVVVSLAGCKKDGDDEEEIDDISIGSGTFTYKGNTYSGNCVQVPATSGASGKIDVLTATADGRQSFVLYNLPKSSSGSINIVRFDGNTGGSSGAFALATLSSATLLSSVSGTVTKTGSNSFTFSIKMTDLTTDQESTATGSGEYK